MLLTVWCHMSKQKFFNDPIMWCLNYLSNIVSKVILIWLSRILVTKWQHTNQLKRKLFWYGFVYLPLHSKWKDRATNTRCTRVVKYLCQYVLPFLQLKIYTNYFLITYHYSGFLRVTVIGAKFSIPWTTTAYAYKYDILEVCRIHTLLPSEIETLWINR